MRPHAVGSAVDADDVEAGLRQQIDVVPVPQATVRGRRVPAVSFCKVGISTGSTAIRAALFLLVLCLSRTSSKRPPTIRRRSRSGQNAAAAVAQIRLGANSGAPAQRADERHWRPHGLDLPEMRAHTATPPSGRPAFTCDVTFARLAHPARQCPRSRVKHDRCDEPDRPPRRCHGAGRTNAAPRMKCQMCRRRTCCVGYRCRRLVVDDSRVGMQVNLVTCILYSRAEDLRGSSKSLRRGRSPAEHVDAPSSRRLTAADLIGSVPVT